MSSVGLISLQNEKVVGIALLEPTFCLWKLLMRGSWDYFFNLQDVGLIEMVVKLLGIWIALWRIS